MVNGHTSRENVERTVSVIREAGGHAVGIMADVSDSKDVGRLVAEANLAFGPVDIATPLVDGSLGHWSSVRWFHSGSNQPHLTEKTPRQKPPKHPAAFRPQCPDSIRFQNWAGGECMRLTFKHSDGFRSDYLLILDEDTGKEVGNIRLGGMNSSGSIDIWMFDGKYQTRVQRYDTAVGFVLGVESVLNHRQDPQFALRAAKHTGSGSFPRPTNPTRSNLRVVGGSWA